MRVALVHDYLTQMGGAERVLAALHDLFPDATVWTSLVDRAALPPEWATWDIRPASRLSVRLPARQHRLLLPLYPPIFAGIGRHLSPELDLLISDSSAWAHRVVAPPGVPHLCYCHSPARFLWGDAAYLGPARLPRVARPALDAVFAALRHGDRRAAARVTRFLANSATVARRIEAAYGVVAPVVYPPVELDRFAADHGPPEDWFLVVSRLVPHKRVDLAIAACERAGVPLKIIGTGRDEARLRATAPPGVEVLGGLDDGKVAAAMGRCRALIVPAMEDFGITAVEAQAAGRPVVALGAGGALETVVHGETGILFAEPTVDSLAEALWAVDHIDGDVARCRANAARFHPDRFRAAIGDHAEDLTGQRPGGT